MNLEKEPTRKSVEQSQPDNVERPLAVSANRRAVLNRTAPKSISRTTVNFILDCVLLVAFLTLLWTATVVHFVFPPGPDAGGWTLWGLNFVQWSDIHFAVLCVLALGILVHIMLHWTWVCSVASKAIRRGKPGRQKMDDGTRTLLGVATLIVLLHVVGIGVAAAWLSISPPLVH